MIEYLPNALINGAEHFGAKKLAEELTKKDLNVVGLSGGLLEGWIGEKWEEHRSVWEVKKRVNYVFDFVGDEEVWKKAAEDEAKLTVVWVGKGDWSQVEKRLQEWSLDKPPSQGYGELNWRLVIGLGVYGPGMGEDEFLAKVVRQAVGNQTMSLPGNNKPLRLLAVEDLIEAVLRASFLSGTDGETMVVAGEEVRSERVAEVLISEAKMTKIEVKEYGGVVEDISKEVAESTWSRLRWKPEVDFKEGIKETLQYYFTLVDEENRRRKIESKNKRSQIPAFAEAMAGKSDVGSREERSEDGPGRMKVEVVEEETDRGSLIVDRGKAGEEMEESKDLTRPARKWTEVTIEDEMADKTDRGSLIVDRGKAGSEILVKKEEIEKEEERIIPNWNEVKEEAGETEEAEIEEEDDEISDKTDRGSLIVDRRETGMWGADQDRKVPVNPWKERMEDWKQLAKSEEKPKVEVEEVVKVNTLPVVSAKPRVGKNRWWQLTVAATIVSVIISLMVPASWVWAGYQAGKGAREFEKLAAEGKYIEAKKMAEESLIKVRGVEKKIDDYGMKRIGVFRDLAKGLKVIEEVLVLEKESLGVIDRGEKLSAAVFREGEVDWKAEMSGLGKDMELMESRIGLLQARLGGDLRWVPGRWRGEVQKAIKQIEETRTLMNLGRRSLEILPEVLGTDGKRREFLVIFQNEMEIRPTGGFIGSYGIITFEGGKLINLEIKDIYSADGQLKGHVEPPAEIKMHLGEGGWFMRDANWQASFTASAKDLAWFLDKETGRKVDGVIGVNLAAAREMLGVTGEIFVPDFKEKVSKENLYEQAEFYSENKFFPGSNQKESFLGLLGKQMFEEIKNLNGSKRLEMVEVVVDLLERNEIQIALNEKKAAMEVARLGWDGSLFEGKCATEGCMADYLYLVEANLGVNKANYFIYRNIEEMVEITPSIVSRVVKVNYENTAKNTNWPGGDYKNYMRVYVPMDINLSEISVYNSDDPASKKVYKSDELRIRQVGNKREIGFLVMVPVLKKRTVEIRYATTIDLNKTGKFSYMNYIQRQSGYGQTGYVGLVSYPEGWGPSQVQPSASLVGNRLLFNQKFDRDIKMGVEIGK